MASPWPVSLLGGSNNSLSMTFYVKDFRLLIGPPAGGALYSRFGYRGPFVFGMAATVIDLVGRLLIIERKEALCHGVDPAANPNAGADKDNERHIRGVHDNSEIPSASQEKGNGVDSAQSGPNAGAIVELLRTADAEDPASPGTKKSLSLLAVVMKLAKSTRALIAFFITLVYGYVLPQVACCLGHNQSRRIIYSSQEPALPLHLQTTWGLDSSKVGLIFLAAVVPTLFCKSMDIIVGVSQTTLIKL